MILIIIIYALYDVSIYTEPLLPMPQTMTNINKQDLMNRPQLSYLEA